MFFNVFLAFTASALVARAARTIYLVHHSKLTLPEPGQPTAQLAPLDANLSSTTSTASTASTTSTTSTTKGI